LIKKKQIFFSQAHFEVLKNLKDMKFCNRKFEIISNFNNKKIFIFYLNYYFYKLFYPPFKTTKPFYSIYYLFDKLSIFFKDSIIKKLLKIIINIFNKNKFFKTLD
jgi:hypothetical protein